ncbi:hypothetical protein BH23CHL1_BH23CHL1_04650 [soil metagenome]
MYGCEWVWYGRKVLMDLAKKGYTGSHPWGNVESWLRGKDT